MCWNTLRIITTCYLSDSIEKLHPHCAMQKHTHSSCYTPVISCNRHILHRHIAIDAIIDTHTLVPVCTTQGNTHSDMRVTAIPHTCMDTHNQSDCIQEHPSYVSSCRLLGCLVSVPPLSLYLSLSLTLTLFPSVLTSVIEPHP